MGHSQSERSIPSFTYREQWTGVKIQNGDRLGTYGGIGCIYLTIILRNRAEYHLILRRRGRRPNWLNQGIFRKIEQDNCFIIQHISIAYHFQNEKNYGSMIKTLKASNT